MKHNMRRAIAMLLMVCMVLSMLPVTAIAAELHPADGWTVMNEGDNLTINAENSITIQTREGDLNKVGQNPEPTSYWLHDAPAGDFTATVKISGGFSKSYQKAGILIYKDLGNTVSAVRRHHSGFGGNVFGMFQYLDTWDETSVSDPNPSDSAWIKLVKTGNVFEGFYSFDNETWTSMGKVTNTTIGASEELKVGVYVVDGSAPNGQFLDVTFEDFTIDGESIPFASDATNVPAASISLNRASMSLNAGESETLTVSWLPSYATEPVITWASSDESVAAVSGGVVTAVSDGTATVTASAGDLEAQCEVTVYAAIDGIKLILSDMDWDNTNFVTYSTGWGALGLNAGVNGEGGLSLGGVEYEKGIAAHASSRIDLNIGDYEAFLFTADIGLNDSAGNNGIANFVVEIDGEEVFRKDDVKGTDDAYSVRIDIPAGSTTLSLITEEGNTLSGEKNAYDHTVWANAILAVPADAEDRAEEKQLQRVIDMIDALGEITAESVSAVAAARKAYDGLSALQKEKVLNLPVLEAAEAALKEMGAAIEQRMTPLMGWSSWNCYYANINEEKLVSQMDALISTGLADAGYTYFNVDDAYQNGRNEDGSLRVNTEKFPNGMKYIADYAHDLGLKAGIYSDGGADTCASMHSGEGSRGEGVGLYGHWEEDLRMYFLEWGYDYIKVDWCGGVRLGLDRQTEYTKIGALIDQIELEKGTDIVYNVCCWAFPGAWVADIADSWRISGDITCSFSSILTQIDDASVLSKYHGPGHINDPDMLMVGNGMTHEEDKSHFAMWCMLAAPLVLGNDLTKMKEETLEILTNEELIAIDQDPAVIMAQVVKENDGVQTWVKPLGSEDSNEKAVALLNRNNYEVTTTVSWAELGFTGNVQVRDLWAHEDLTVGSTYTVTLPAHGTAVLKITGETEASKAVIKGLAVSRPADFDVTAEGTLDWAQGEESKDNAYIINDLTDTSVTLSAVSTQRTAKIAITTEGEAVVTAVLDGKQTMDVISAGELFTLVYNTELGGPDVTVTVEGGTIEAISVADTPAAAAEPEQEILSVWNAPNAGYIDPADDCIDYIYVGGNGGTEYCKSGILSTPSTAEGAESNYNQTDPYDYFEVILPAAAEPTRADIYYTLLASAVSATVECGDQVKTLGYSTAVIGDPNVLSIVYTSAEEVRVTITVTATFAEASSMTLQTIVLDDVAENTLGYPTVTQEGTSLSITADSVAVTADAADTLKAVVTDAEGNEILVEDQAVTLDGELAMSLTLPEDFTEGELVLSLEKAGQSYTLELPVKNACIPAEQDPIGYLLAHELVESGAILVDVRSDEEYNAAHIDGAINILYTDIITLAESKLPDKDQAIVVYCSAGKRSAQAQMALLALGYTNVYNMGAMDNWYIEPAIEIGGSSKGVKDGELISLTHNGSIFEKDLELYYTVGADTGFEDAVPVPETGTVAATGDGCVKAYLLWKGETVATAERQLPMLVNLPIPDYEIDTYMTDLTWTKNTCGWGSNQKDKSNDGNTLNIAGNTFTRGIGAHANSVIEAAIPEGAGRFVAVAGADAEIAESAIKEDCRLQFAVFVDDVLMDQSLELPYGCYHVFDILLPEGAKTIRLEAYTTDDGDRYDHADWGIAGFATVSQEDLDAAAAEAVMNQIAALGEIKSLDQEAEVVAAREAYDALTDEQKALVGEEFVEALETAEAMLEILKLIAEAELLNARDRAGKRIMELCLNHPNCYVTKKIPSAASAAIQAAESIEEIDAIMAEVEAAFENGCPAESYPDVVLSEWYHRAVDFVVGAGIMKGDDVGTFRPTDPITRAEMAQILYNLNESPEFDTDIVFSDVAESDWWYNAVMWAAANGYVKGDLEGTYRPEDLITREEMITIIWRYMGSETPASTELNFTDAGEAQEWAIIPIAWGVENSVVKGTGNNMFEPTSDTERAAIAQVMLNLFG